MFCAGGSIRFVFALGMVGTMPAISAAEEIVVGMSAAFTGSTRGVGIEFVDDKRFQSLDDWKRWRK